MSNTLEGQGYSASQAIPIFSTKQTARKSTSGLCKNVWPKLQSHKYMQGLKRMQLSLPRIPCTRRESGSMSSLLQVQINRKRPSAVVCNVSAKKRRIASGVECLCYRVVPIADILSTCARTGTYAQYVESKEEVPVIIQSNQPSAKAKRQKKMASSLKGNMKAKGYLPSVSGVKNTKKQSRFLQSKANSLKLVSKVSRKSRKHKVASRLKFFPIRLPSTQHSIKKRTKNPKAQTTKIDESAHIQSKLESLSSKTSNEANQLLSSDQYKLITGTSSIGIQTDSTVECQTEPSEVTSSPSALMVRIDRSLVSTQQCTVAVEHLGACRTTETQTNSEIVVNEQSLQALVKTVMKGSLKALKSRLKVTTAKAEQLLQNNHRLEQLLHENTVALLDRDKATSSSTDPVTPLCARCLPYEARQDRGTNTPSPEWNDIYLLACDVGVYYLSIRTIYVGMIKLSSLGKLPSVTNKLMGVLEHFLLDFTFSESTAVTMSNTTVTSMLFQLGWLAKNLANIKENQIPKTAASATHAIKKRAEIILKEVMKILHSCEIKPPTEVMEGMLQGVSNPVVDVSAIPVEIKSPTEVVKGTSQRISNPVTDPSAVCYSQTNSTTGKSIDQTSNAQLPPQQAHPCSPPPLTPIPKPVSPDCRIKSIRQYTYKPSTVQFMRSQYNQVPKPTFAPPLILRRNVTSTNRNYDSATTNQHAISPTNRHCIPELPHIYPLKKVTNASTTASVPIPCATGSLPAHVEAVKPLANSARSFSTSSCTNVTLPTLVCTTRSPCSDASSGISNITSVRPPKAIEASLATPQPTTRPPSIEASLATPRPTTRPPSIEASLATPQSTVRPPSIEASLAILESIARYLCSIDEPFTTVRPPVSIEEGLTTIGYTVKHPASTGAPLTTTGFTVKYPVSIGAPLTAPGSSMDVPITAPGSTVTFPTTAGSLPASVRSPSISESQVPTHRSSLSRKIQALKQLELEVSTDDDVGTLQNRSVRSLTKKIQAIRDKDKVVSCCWVKNNTNPTGTSDERIRLVKEQVLHNSSNHLGSLNGLSRLPLNHSQVISRSDTTCSGTNTTCSEMSHFQY